MWDHGLTLGFRQIESLVQDVSRLTDISLRLARGDSIDSSEKTWLERFSYEKLHSAVYVGEHFVQAVQMREAARKAGSFVWFCSAQYLLCRDWRMVIEAVPWEAWGGGRAKDEIKRATCVIVAAYGWMEPESLSRVLSGPTLDPKAVIEECEKLHLIRRWRRYYAIGKYAPKPYV